MRSDDVKVGDRVKFVGEWFTVNEVWGGGSIGTATRRGVYTELNVEDIEAHLPFLPEKL